MTHLSFLTHKDFVYTRLKLLVWAANGAILPTTLQAAAGKALTHIVLEEQCDKPLVINCREVVEIEDHALETTKDALNRTRRPLVLMHAEQFDPTSIRRELGDPHVTHHIGETEVIVYGEEFTERAVVTQLVREASILEKSYVKKIVKQCFRRFSSGKKERMSSTPLLTSGVFDARPIISNPNKFAWVSILMAERLQHYLNSILWQPNAGEDNKARTRGIRLLAVSLRGSPFAAAVGLLTSTQNTIEIVDHMGPKYRILEDPSFMPSVVNEDYVYIGDFVVGGTELRIAQTYARSRGSSLQHAVVVGCMLDSTEYGFGIEISCLVDLKGCCSGDTFPLFENQD